jgi:hypothetical protein
MNEYWLKFDAIFSFLKMISYLSLINYYVMVKSVTKFNFLVKHFLVTACFTVNVACGSLN